MPYSNAYYFTTLQVLNTYEGHTKEFKPAVQAENSLGHSNKN